MTKFIALAVGLAMAAVVLHAGDARYPLPPSTERVMYLRSGRAAGRLMLSFDALAADVYWIRTIQHYGRDRRSKRSDGRFELLYPLLDLTTTLDPYFNIAYRFGAIFLAQPAPYGPDRVDQAIALLEKGLSNNPNQWKYALDIGFIYYWYGTGRHQAASDFKTAAEWFERASAMPAAPVWLKPLAAITRAQGGDRAAGRKMLAELGQSEEVWIRRAAERGLQQLQALDDIDDLQGAVDRYTSLHNAPPQSWADLVRAGLLQLRGGGTPTDPTAVPYEFDPVAGRVRLSPQSSLGPLPSTLSAR
jgi:tetratricopeptide (TPR) repeat protein